MDFLPPFSWDTHVHVFDPIKYPYIPNTRYNPPARSVQDLVTSTPTKNFIIVMSGPEGTDTAQTIDAIEQLERDGRNAKGVVVMDIEKMTIDNLQRLNDAGVRSVRFNTRRDEITTLDSSFEEAVRRIHTAGVKWSVEAAIFDVALWYRLGPTLRKLHGKYGTIFIADHVFAAQPSQLESTEFKSLLDLVEDGMVVVKISGLTRYGRDAVTMMPVVKEVLKRRNGTGCVWGSDWPHVNSSPGATNLMEVDILEHLRLLKCVCDKLGNGTWEKVMRDNAVSVYI
ncbi:uncharacterized protein TRUGW13939_07578 [Talaromyces rugulosus]|uniref:Amidohydrolase-related domain-containing protein n=1 Tax=Talaromyces rugulosus TaxID=121627 RepID=A0A7H8R6I2_TALRU|nr:uncharacterized protein TRUGW13939_07578 [Talaromyces rugulosus]QKX60433.1 hypothetical protein TRUGW13939_07578 [Talaromyces rugulosus]